MLHLHKRFIEEGGLKNLVKGAGSASLQFTTATIDGILNRTINGPRHPIEAIKGIHDDARLLGKSLKRFKPIKDVILKTKYHKNADRLKNELSKLPWHLRNKHSDNLKAYHDGSGSKAEFLKKTDDLIRQHKINDIKGENDIYSLARVAGYNTANAVAVGAPTYAAYKQVKKRMDKKKETKLDKIKNKIEELKNKD